MGTWRDIPGYEGYYMVSDTGAVKSVDRVVNNKNGTAVRSGRILTLSIKGNYYQVCLWKKNVGRWFLVHRLVAMAFLENERGLPEVNHKDENTKNNSVENLEWCDRSYNHGYGTRQKRIAEKRRGVPVGEQSVSQYDKSGTLLQTFKSAKEAAKAIGGDNSAICKCANGKSKSSYGFVWKWATA